MNSPIEIRIDTKDLFSGITVSQEEVDSYVDRVIKDLTYSYLGQVEKEAQRTLHSTRSRYVQNLHFIDSGRLEGTALLDYSKDTLIRMLEEGAAPFDMKEYFLKSAKVKYTKSGKPYLTVPFRFSTPGAVGESDVFQSKLPQDVYDIVKSKPTNILVPGGGSRSAGLKLDELPDQYQLVSSRPKLPEYPSYEHKNSIYEGITKNVDSVTGQSRYGSFRRISENSDPQSWIHSGIEAKGLMEQGMNNFQMENEIIRSLDMVFEQMGFTPS